MELDVVDWLITKKLTLDAAGGEATRVWFHLLTKYFRIDAGLTTGPALSAANENSGILPCILC